MNSTQVGKGAILFAMSAGMLIQLAIVIAIVFIAARLSYKANRSIPWAIIHGILGILYILYYLIFKRQS